MVHNHLSLSQSQFCCDGIDRTLEKITPAPTMHSHFVIEVAAVDLASICKFGVGVIGVIVPFTAANYLHRLSLNADVKGKPKPQRAFLTSPRFYLTSDILRRAVNLLQSDPMLLLPFNWPSDPLCSLPSHQHYACSYEHIPHFLDCCEAIGMALLDSHCFPIQTRKLSSEQPCYCQHMSHIRPGNEKYATFSPNVLSHTRN
jgi:hypothetical protein